MSRLFADKQIMNPMNPDEVFTCKDLMNGKCNFKQPHLKINCLDYKICRKEKKMQTTKLSQYHSCYEYRALGKLSLMCV